MFEKYFELNKILQKQHPSGSLFNFLVVLQTQIFLQMKEYCLGQSVLRVQAYSDRLKRLFLTSLAGQNACRNGLCQPQV